MVILIRLLSTSVKHAVLAVTDKHICFFFFHFLCHCNSKGARIRVSCAPSHGQAEATSFLTTTGFGTFTSTANSDDDDIEIVVIVSCLTMSGLACSLLQWFSDDGRDCSESPFSGSSDERHLSL